MVDVMQAKEWLEMLGRNSVLLVVLLALSYFIYRKVWPFVERQIEQAQSDRRTEHERFIAALAHSNAVHAGVAEKIVGSINELRNEVIRKR